MRTVIKTAALLLCLGSIDTARADSVATLFSTEGTVQTSQTSGQTWISAKIGQEFSVGDVIKTGPQSRAGVRFHDGFLMRLSQRTTFIVRDSLKLNSGEAHFFSRGSKNFPTVETPTVSASVRGTEFVVSAAADVTRITVIDGGVEAENQFGKVLGNKGDEIIISTGSAPISRAVVRPQDSADWALYYPAIVSYADIADVFSSDTSLQIPPGSPAWKQAVADAAILQQNGRADAAVERLESASVGAGCGLYLFKAGLLLSRGSVTQAQQALDAAESRLAQAPLAAAPRLNSAIRSTRALIKFVSGDVDGARAIAINATPAASSAESFIRSYIHQADFDIPGAQREIDEALAGDPNSQSLQLRRAELLLSDGRINAAKSEASRAVSSGGESAYAESLLGFATLMRGELQDAKSYFTKAIELDPAFAPSRLGLGLALINGGDLEAGRKEIEHAAHLDAQYSLYRSYLGKALFEEENEALASKEFKRAIELDPSDPTPFLYRSFMRLSQHRPVEALEDIQDSIDRNDDRAAFRSRFLLDQDASVRSTGLAQVFDRLGFSELARIEASKAINQNYSNYSAHYLLADAYDGRELLDDASVFEDLIANLMVPVNYNSIVSNDANNPAGLNEYSALFDRPVTRYKFLGNYESAAERFDGGPSAAGSTGDLAWSFRYNFTFDNGFDDLQINRLHTLGHSGRYQLTPSTRVIWEAGAGWLRDDQDDPDDLEIEQTTDSYIARAGVNQRLGDSGGQLIATIGTSNGDNELVNDVSRFFDAVNEFEEEFGDETNVDPGADFEDLIEVERQIGQGEFNETVGEVQHIWDSNAVSFVTGSNYTNLHGNISQTFTFSDGTSFEESRVSTDRNLWSAYLYSTIHAARWLDINAGAAYNSFEFFTEDNDITLTDAVETVDKLNPKFGAMAYLGDLTLRAAYFKQLTRAFQGGTFLIEPTLIGGFNQVYDDFPGSSFDFFGAGADYRLSKKTFTGLEYNYRDISSEITQPESDLDPEGDFGLESEVDEFNEHRGRWYLYQVLGKRISASLDYSFTELERSISKNSTTTNVAGLGVNYFDTSGFFAFVSGAYRYQRQEFGGVLRFSDHEEFWLLDAVLGYQLPKRHGAIALAFRNLLDERFETYRSIRGESELAQRLSVNLNISVNF